MGWEGLADMAGYRIWDRALALYHRADSCCLFTFVFYMRDGVMTLLNSGGESRKFCRNGNGFGKAENSKDCSPSSNFEYLEQTRYQIGQLSS